jgi:hypothetical protein
MLALFHPAYLNPSALPRLSLKTELLVSAATYAGTQSGAGTAQPDPTFLAVPFRLYKGYISVSLKKTLSPKMCARWAHRNID